jgi:CBS domain-containing protein
VAFRALIGIFHNLLFLGRLSATYDANTHTPASPWGPFVILVPVVGAFGVAFLVKNFAPEAKGHGVPEVMDAVYHRKGVIRAVVSVVKAVASALSIGSRAASIMNSRLEIVRAGALLQDVGSKTNEVFIVTDASGGVVGAVTKESLKILGNAKPTTAIGEIVEPGYVIVSPDDSVWEVVAAMRAADSALALVAPSESGLSATRVQGVITRKILLDVLAADMELFGV